MSPHPPNLVLLDSYLQAQGFWGLAKVVFHVVFVPFTDPVHPPGLSVLFELLSSVIKGYRLLSWLAYPTVMRLGPVVVCLNGGSVVIWVCCLGILCSLISECKLTNLSRIRTPRLNFGSIPSILRGGPGSLLLDVYLYWSLAGGWVRGGQGMHCVVIRFIAGAPDIVLACRNCRLLGNEIIEGRRVASSNTLPRVTDLLQKLGSVSWEIC